MSTFSRFLNRLRSRFDGIGVPFVIGGSFALATRGHPRFTDDIDLMVLAQDLETVHRAFPRDEYELIKEVTFRDVGTGLLIDVILVEDEAQRWAFANATPEEIQGASPVRVLTPEGLSVMLLREATNGDPRKRSLRLRDVELMAAHDGVDLRPVEEWAARMGYGDAFASLHLPGRPRP